MVCGKLRVPSIDSLIFRVGRLTRRFHSTHLTVKLLAAASAAYEAF